MITIKAGRTEITIFLADFACPWGANGIPNRDHPGFIVLVLLAS